MEPWVERDDQDDQHLCAVMPWLDHGIHAVTVPLDGLAVWRSIGMDCRIKSCNDL